MTMTQSLFFIRHGATQPNLDGVRCGGDLDVPLTERGQTQVWQAALALRQSWPASQRVDVIVTSDLQRTMESAEIVASVLGTATVFVEPLFRERQLGAWNLASVESTREALVRGDTPPGGESNDAFLARVAAALKSLDANTAGQRVLLVGSKGVARGLRAILTERVTAPRTASAVDRFAIDNAEVLSFDWPRAHAHGHPTSHPRAATFNTTPTNTLALS